MQDSGKEELYLYLRPAGSSFPSDSLASVLVARMTAGGTLPWEQTTGPGPVTSLEPTVCEIQDVLLC